jgi:outer membrane protein OmpA-like peptidoglycan-associated protein
MKTLNGRTDQEWQRFDRIKRNVAIVFVVVLVALWLAGLGPRCASCGEAAKDVAKDMAIAAPAAAAPTRAVTPALPNTPNVPTSTSTTSDTVSNTAANLGQFSADWGTGKLILKGTLASDASKRAFIQTATSAVGAGNFIEQLEVVPQASIGAWANDPVPLLAIMRVRGDTSITVEGNRVLLAGSVPSEAERGAREGWARQYFGGGAAIDNQLTVVSLMNTNVVKRIGSCDGVLQIPIEFERKKADLTAEGRVVLDKIASCLVDVNIEVGGHTDGRGTPELNAQLSQERADAVVAYLAGKGMNRAKLIAKGYGSAKPIADNDTLEGRQKNRRIEFVAR